MKDMQLLIKCKEMTLAKDTREIQKLKDELFNMSDVRKLGEFFYNILSVTKIFYYHVLPTFRNKQAAAMKIVALNSKFVVKHIFIPLQISCFDNF